MHNQVLFQVNVEDRRNGSVYPVGPAMIKEAAGLFMAAITAKIIDGSEKVWANPHLVPRIKQG